MRDLSWLICVYRVFVVAWLAATASLKSPGEWVHHPQLRHHVCAQLAGNAVQLTIAIGGAIEQVEFQCGSRRGNGLCRRQQAGNWQKQRAGQPSAV